MAAEIGNEYAKGHGYGRPYKYDLDDLSQKLLKWSKSPSSMTLLDFADEYDFDASCFNRWSQTHEVFHEALRITKTRIAARRERLVSYGKLDRGAFNRYQAMYDSMLREHEREEKEFEYGLKSKIEEHKDKGITVNLIQSPWKDGNDRITE